MLYTIAIHGGAGTIRRDSMTKVQQEAYEQGLQQALDSGYAILAGGGSSLDAVTAAVVALEDCPLFNAGRGAVFNHEGKHEMDASVMSGRTLRAGAVAGVSNIRNPVLLARAVMEHSEHVILSGAGAADFARQQGIATAPDTWFYMAERYRQWQEALHDDSVRLDHTEKKFGTVGAVALDSQGNLAAATSTGGMTNKKFGRIGDSPVIGAGTYARNSTCAVSCTGHGEYFLRAVVAHDISCLMAYKGLSLAEACHTLVQETLAEAGGEGGLVAVDAQGNIAMPFNSEGMYRGCRHSNGFATVHIYKD